MISRGNNLESELVLFVCNDLFVQTFKCARHQPPKSPPFFPAGGFDSATVNEGGSRQPWVWD